MYCDVRVDPDKYYDLVPPGRRDTFVIAAYNASLQSRAQADIVCPGHDDELVINMVMAWLPAGGGRVSLTEGRFVPAHSIAPPINNITLAGQAHATFIDCDALPTGEHGVVVSGVTDCVLRDFSIQTEDGSGKTCDCIYIEDTANAFHVEHIEIVESANDGIRIAGTTILTGHIHGCHIHGADANGIQVNMDGGAYMYRLHIVDCDITGTGLSGIYFANRCDYALVEGNVIFLTGLDGIQVLSSDYSELNNNILFQNTQSGISVSTSTHVGVNNNICYNNTRYGIYLGNSDECILEGNICTLNDSADTATFDGIHLNNTSTKNLVMGNHCCENHNYGIACYGANNSIVSNFVHDNDQHGIYVSAARNLVEGNWLNNNGHDGAGTYHGIYLTVNADNSGVVGNYIWADHAVTAYTEDGICLVDGAVNCQITGNHIYDLLGSGIMLTANNDDCLIAGNYIELCDNYGVEIAAATCDHNMVKDNKLLNNVTGAILDAGTATHIEGNHGTTPVEDKVLDLMKNTSGGNLVAGDVVCYETVPVTGDEFETSNVQGSDRIHGVLAEDIVNNAHGYVQRLGKVTTMRATNTDGGIAVGDFLCQSSVAEEAGLAGAGDMAFAIALEVCAAVDCVLDALLIVPRKL